MIEMTLTYPFLLSVWRKSMRNMRIKKLNPLERAFFRAAISYAKLKGKIVNNNLVEKLQSIVIRVCESLKEKIFKHGIERASQMLKGGCYKVFPVIRRWINEDAYIMWLGTDLLIKKHLFIMA